MRVGHRAARRISRARSSPALRSLPCALRGSSRSEARSASAPCAARGARGRTRAAPSSLTGGTVARHDDGRPPPAATRGPPAPCTAGIGDGRMREQRLLHLCGRDVLAPADDHVVGAAEHVQVPVLVEAAEIAGAQPAVRARRAGRHVRSADADRARLSIRTSVGRIGGPGRAGPLASLAGRQRGHLRGRLGEPVGRRDRHAGVERALEQLGAAPAHRRAARSAAVRAARRRPAGASSIVGHERGDRDRSCFDQRARCASASKRSSTTRCP